MTQQNTQQQLPSYHEATTTPVAGPSHDLGAASFPRAFGLSSGTASVHRNIELQNLSLDEAISTPPADATRSDSARLPEVVKSPRAMSNLKRGIDAVSATPRIRFEDEGHTKKDADPSDKGSSKKKPFGLGAVLGKAPKEFPKRDYPKELHHSCCQQRSDNTAATGDQPQPFQYGCKTPAAMEEEYDADISVSLDELEPLVRVLSWPFHTSAEGQYETYFLLPDPDEAVVAELLEAIPDIGAEKVGYQSISRLAVR